MVITPNKIELIGEEITRDDSFLDYRELYLTLQRALLKCRMFNGMKQIGESYKREQQIYKEGQNVNT